MLTSLAASQGQITIFARAPTFLPPLASFCICTDSRSHMSTVLYTIGVIVSLVGTGFLVGVSDLANLLTFKLSAELR